jgi:chromosome segregation ATPase
MASKAKSALEKLATIIRDIPSTNSAQRTQLSTAQTQVRTIADEFESLEKRVTELEKKLK